MILASDPILNQIFTILWRNFSHFGSLALWMTIHLVCLCLCACCALAFSYARYRLLAGLSMVLCAAGFAHNPYIQSIQYVHDLLKRRAARGVSPTFCWKLNFDLSPVRTIRILYRWFVDKVKAMKKICLFWV